MVERQVGCAGSRVRMKRTPSVRLRFCTVPSASRQTSPRFPVHCGKCRHHHGVNETNHDKVCRLKDEKDMGCSRYTKKIERTHNDEHGPGCIYCTWTVVEFCCSSTAQNFDSVRGTCFHPYRAAILLLTFRFVQNISQRGGYDAVLVDQLFEIR